MPTLEGSLDQIADQLALRLFLRELCLVDVRRWLSSRRTIPSRP